jgi:hypothetical protein
VRPFEIGLLLVTGQHGDDRVTPRWPEIREVALRVEAVLELLAAG